MKRTVSFSQDSTNVFFHILTNCNLKCRYCYINRAQHGDITLPLTTINAWLNTFADQNKGANLVFLGGEPTLHPKLPAAIKTASRLGYGSITVDTNGYLFHDILFKVHPDEVDYFSFSLDGAARSTNDRIRGAGCYDTCIAGIKEAVSRGFSASLIYTISSVNIDELELLGTLLEDLPIDRCFFQVIGIRGRSKAKQRDKLQVSRSEWLEKIPAAAEQIAQLGITVTYPRVFLAPSEPFQCAGQVAENYFIFPNGRVYQCPLCEDFPVHSLFIKDNQLMETESINEKDLFQLEIPEGCVMNKLIQPGNLCYSEDGTPLHKVGCCLLKEEISYK
ncbi:MAG: radical SAM protein [Deltaproteobacteria bacterium]|nr:MAG: radical SAM protein [Deltaproteobacteria bacterium]